MANEEVPCYIGRAECGCVLAVTVDDGETPKETAKFVAEMIERGHAVERVTVGWVRTNKFGHHLDCPKRVPPPAPTPMQEALEFASSQTWSLEFARTQL